MKPFPWRAAIGFGLGVLKLPPAQFWAMTPRELAFAIEAVRGPSREPIDRAALYDLMSRFPDTLS
ncbi:MAG: phage tail assembly chaperone [Bradyrhizobiaceae bacterium]|nr:MAG: phage tail assembly chaperone [Bradyrhizobiaceae bacterium]